MAGPANSAQVLQQTQQFQKGMQTPEQELQAAQQNLGATAAQQQVTGLRGAISNTTNLLNQVAPSVMGRTGQSLVTTAQANAQIANEQAPISQKLNQQDSAYNQAQQDYADLEQKAEAIATANEQAQQNHLSYLENLYQTLYSGEQTRAQQAEQKREFDTQMAEQRREANLGASSGGTMSPSLGSLFGGLPSGGAAAAKASMQQRGGGGFNFSYNGKGINAAQYAHLTGQNFRSVLSKMASKGDAGAKAALAFVGNDFGYDPRKITQQWQANLYKALTGRNAAVRRAPAKSSSRSYPGQNIGNYNLGVLRK